MVTLNLNDFLLNNLYLPFIAKGKITNIETNDESNMIFEIVNDIFVGIDYELDYNNKTALTKITTKYIKHPIDVLHINQIVKVWVLSVDHVKRRIQLTMIKPEEKN